MLYHWIVAFCIFFLILLLILAISFSIKNRKLPPTSPPETPPAVSFWGNETPSSNAEKNVCMLYEFPTAYTITSPVSSAYPGNPTFNTSILDSVTGSTGLPECLDFDEIIAQQVSRSCIGVPGNDNVVCRLLNGGFTGYGGSETFYDNKSCPNITACVGQLALIAINTNTGTYPNCISLNDSGEIQMSVCDPSNPDQIFRITRTQPGVNPETLSPSNNQQGILTQILHKETNLCLMAGTETVQSTFDNINNPPVPCTNPNDGVTYYGVDLVLGACTGGEYPGYLWASNNSYEFCGEIGGCDGCKGLCTSEECTRPLQENLCSGCTSCTGAEYMTTPPQITFLGDVRLPKTGTSYKGLKGNSALFQFMIDNNLGSIFYGHTSDVGFNPILTEKVGLDAAYCPHLAFASQYITIPLFNQLYGAYVCLAAGNNPQCFQL